MLAVLGGHTDCVHLLLDNGASPDAKDKRGSTALYRGVSYTIYHSGRDSSAATIKQGEFSSTVNIFINLTGVKGIVIGIDSCLLH